MNSHQEGSLLPERIAVLPDSALGRYMKRGVLTGRHDLPRTDLDRASHALDGSNRWKTGPVRELIDEAVGRFDGAPAAADAWLAPRLHAVLRMSRAEASDSGVWNFLAARVAPDYIHWRHPGRNPDRPSVARERFCGPFHKQTFARLWWMAELFRDGCDYGPVHTACGVQDMFHTVLRLEIIHHRPIARAFVRLIEDGKVTQGREVNALAAAVNAAGSTVMFEFLSPDEPTDGEAYRAWVEEAGTVLTPYDSLPEGPDEGSIPSSSVQTLLPLFEDLFDNAPVRGKGVEE